MSDLISPIPLYSHLNPNGQFRQDRVDRGLRQCTAVAATLMPASIAAAQDALDRNHDLHVGILADQGTHWAWGTPDDTRAKLFKTVSSLPQVDMLRFHYEGEPREVAEYDALYAMAHQMGIQSVHWYNYPGWHAEWSGFGFSTCTPWGARTDARSYNLYCQNAAEASLTIEHNLGAGPEIPSICLTGSYRSTKRGWRYNRDAHRGIDETYNMGVYIGNRLDRFTGLILYPGITEAKINLEMHDLHLDALIQGMIDK